MKAYPTWFYISLLIALFGLAISGLLLIPTSLEMRFEWDVFWRLSGEQRLVSVAIHTTLSYLILVKIGALSRVHMQAGLKNKRNRISGISLIILFTLLALTGVGLFYLGEESWILPTSSLHIFAGIALIGVFTSHFLFKPKPQS